MLRMDYQLKGFILKCTLKSYTTTPMESATVLRSHNEVLWGFQVQDPQQEEEEQAQVGEVLGQVQEGSSLSANPLPEA